MEGGPLCWTALAASLVVSIANPGCGRIGFDALPDDAVIDAGPGEVDAALPPTTCIQDIKVGVSHVCALRSDDRVFCWGQGIFGAAPDVYINPVEMLGLPSGIESVHASEFFSCAFGSNELWCWGTNPEGQLGSGNTMDSIDPVQVPLLAQSVVSSYEVANHHVCAILDGDSLYCWGGGVVGQIGDGNTVDQYAPTPVSGFTSVPGGVLDVDGGHDHTCAVKGDGSVHCWGDNSVGQLGDGSLIAHSIPMPVSSLSGIKSMDCGYSTCCALDGNGQVSCWGDGSSGQLGNGDFNSSATPVVASLPGPATSVGVGEQHSCAVLDDTRVFCWGENAENQLGDGTLNDSAVPVEVMSVVTTQPIQVGSYATAIRTDTGGAMLWGNNFNGELGQRRRSLLTKPTAVQSAETYTQVSSSESHSCAIAADQTLDCWGKNQFGQLGLGHTDDVSVPTPVPGLASVASVAVGAFHVCASTEASAVYCWGRNHMGQLGSDAATNTSTAGLLPSFTADPIVSLHAGDTFTCALTSTLEVFCWGDDVVAGVGDGPLLHGQLYASIDAGGRHVCGLSTTGETDCFGNNNSGQLGDGTIAARSTSSPVSGPLLGLSVISGKNHSCVQTQASEVYCWGKASTSALGDGTSGQPDALLPVLSNIPLPEHWTAGPNYTCSQAAGSPVACVGINALGQMGDGTTARAVTPRDSLYIGLTQLSAGGTQMCGIDTNGLLQCSGHTTNGSVGNGNDLSRVPQPLANIVCP